jgi:pilus assembly protein Flp/PilA
MSARQGNTIPETGRGYMQHYFQRLAAWFDSRDNEEGQTLVEYALIIALVSVVLIGALQLMTGALNGIFSFITSTLNGAIGS